MTTTDAPDREKVARAICRANTEQRCGHNPRLTNEERTDIVECQVHNGWDLWLPEADAAIAALRATPTDPVDLLAGTTPGPWVAQDVGNDAEWEVVKPDPTVTDGCWYVAMTYDDADSGSAEANARLIASAPDLAAENARLRAEVERLSYNGIHTCSDACTRLPCVQRREIEALRVYADMLAGLVARYRNEMPLEHQPYMVAQFVDEALSSYQASKGEGQ